MHLKLFFLLAGEDNESSNEDTSDCSDSDESVRQKCYEIKQQKALPELLKLLTLVNWPECARRIIIIQVLTGFVFFSKFCIVNVI